MRLTNIAETGSERYRHEYRNVSIVFVLIILIFFYRIFLGQLYSPVNLYFFMSPWNAEYSMDGVSGELLSDPIDAGYNYSYELLHESGVPLWGNKAGAGHPATTDVVGQFLNPFQWIYMLIPYFSVANTLDLLFRSFVGLMGMYILLRDFRLHPVAGVAGAAMFVFSQPMVAWMLWPHTRVCVLAPWLLLSVRKLLAGDTRFVLIIGLLTGWMINVTMPAYAVYFLYIVSFYYVVTTVFDLWKSRNYRQFRNRAFRYFFAMLFGVLLATPYMFAFVDQSVFTGYLEQRVENGVSSGYTLAKDWIHLIDPHYYQAIGQKTGHFNEFACFFGVSALFLLVCGMVQILCTRQKQFYYFIVCLAVFAGATFGIEIFSWVRQVPLINLSMITRLIIPAIFLAAILAAKGLDHFLRSNSPRGDVVAVVCGGLGVAFVAVLGYTRTGNAILSQGAVISALFVFAAAYFIALYTRGYIRREVFGVLMLLVLVPDVFRGGIEYLPTVTLDKSSIHPSTAVTSFLQENRGDSRIASLGKWALFPNSSTYYGMADLASHSMVMPNAAIRRYYTAIDAEAYDTNTRVSFKSIQNHSLLNRTSTRYLLTPTSLVYTAAEPFNLAQGDKSPVGEIVSGRIVTQDFRGAEDGLCAVVLGMATYGREPLPGSTMYRLEDATGKTIRQGALPNAEFADNSKFAIDFDPIADSKNQQYTLILTSEDNQQEASPTVWMSDLDQYPDGHATIDGNPVAGDLLFDLKYSPAVMRYVTTASGLEVYENTAALPRAYLTDAAEVVEDPDELFARMEQSDADVTYVEQALPSELAGAGRIMEVDSLDVASNRVTTTTSAPEDALLVLTDLFYPDWHVYVDGEERELYRTNSIFRGVFLEGGDHTVEFVYRPKGLYLGFAIHFATLVTMGLLFWRAHKKRLLPPSKNTAA